jgi:hypothetical protein
MIPTQWYPLQQFSKRAVSFQGKLHPTKPTDKSFTRMERGTLLRRNFNMFF